MTARRSRFACARFALAALCATSLLSLAASVAGAVTCDPSHFPGVDNTFLLPVRLNGVPVTTMRCNQSATNWGAAGILAFAPTSDFDIKLYGSCLGGPLLASSEAAGGTTDFVIGDFNNDPTGYYAADMYCFGGDCTSPTGAYAAATWRTGDLMFVDFPPTTVTFDGFQPFSSDAVLHVWDVWLQAGNTYYFEFSSTLGSGQKMLLFRNPNPGGGTYYAGRGGAEFAVSGCTSYTAPVTGYYGLVVVSDVWASFVYTVGVHSAPTCACATALPELTPVAVSAATASTHASAQQAAQAWVAIGARPAAGSDWDLEVSTSGSSPGCPQTLLANSVAGAGVTDFVMTDLNFSTLPTTLAARAYRYSGGGGATLEKAGHDATYDFLEVNGPQEVHNWGPSEVLKCWDVALFQGESYTFDFFASSNMRVFLYRNPGTSLYSAGRSSADVASATSFEYTAPSTGFYGVVVAKDDDAPGYFALRVGHCQAATPLPAGLPLATASQDFYWVSISGQGGGWQALGTRSTLADWDLSQYGSTTGAPWPDCYSPTGVSSESGSVPDFIVGDFHVIPAGEYPFRLKQFAGGPPVRVDLEWTGAAAPLTVNGPAINVTPLSSELLRIYEAPLVGGHTYTIAYSQADARPLLVFANLAAGDEWAPRNSALLSTLGTTSFTAPASGTFAFVIANDAATGGTFTLRIYDQALLDAGPGVARFETRLGEPRPNPAMSAPTLRYSLASPARVRLDVLDPSGRRVWSGDQGERTSGEWSVTLPRDTGGGRLHAGLYFVHLVVDGRTAGVRKLTLLD